MLIINYYCLVQNVPTVLCACCTVVVYYLRSRINVYKFKFEVGSDAYILYFHGS